MNWYMEVLKNYAGFSGRARRKEYWYFVLFNTIISSVLVFFDGITGTFSEATGMGLLCGIFELVVLIPSLAVSVGGTHYTDRCGWRLLFALVPLIGAIVLLVLLVLDSNSGQNQYGANPKDVIA